MKKTLIITLEYPPIIGGIATYIDQFAGSLDPKQMLLLAPPHKQAKAFDDTRPFTIIRKKPYFPAFLWPRWLRLFFQARKLVKTYGIQMIHVHHILPVGYVAYLLKKLYGVQYIIFSHGTDVAVAAANKRKRKLALKVARAAEQVITNSKNLQERLHKAFPELANHSAVLYPCPDSDFFTAPPESTIQSLSEQLALEGKKVLLTVSRFDEGKGFPHLIRMMPEILRQEPNLIWLIIGDGTDAKRNEILSDIRKYNLQNIVRFIGKIPHKDLKQYYHLADIFVLLTHPDNGREEGLGLVFLEAATAGLPIVAGRSGGVEEAVLHGETGLVVDVKENPESIRDAIVRLLHDDAYATRLGKTGQDRIRTEFHWEEQLKAIQEWM